MKHIRRVNELMCKAEMLVMMAWLGVIFLVICAQVVMRYIMDDPIAWSEEFSRYSFVWITYIGCAYCVGVDNHTRIDFLFAKLDRRVQAALTAVGNLAGIFTFAYILPKGFAYAIDNYRFVTAAMQLPMTYLYMVLPVGCTLTIIHLVLKGILAFEPAQTEGGGAQ